MLEKHLKTTFKHFLNVPDLNAAISGAMWTLGCTCDIRHHKETNVMTLYFRNGDLLHLVIEITPISRFVISKDHVNDETALWLGEMLKAIVIDSADIVLKDYSV